MYEEEIHFGTLCPKQSKTVLAHLTPVTFTFDRVTPTSREFLCCPKTMCGPNL